MAEPAAAAAPAAPAPVGISRAQQVRDMLQPIADRLGTPGAAKLAQQAKREGVRVSREEIRAFLATKGEKQIFRPLPESKGKSASESLDMRFQMDLIDLKYSASRGNKNILVIINVYSRKAYAIPVKDKKPENVAAGLQTLLGSMPAVPTVISSDRGNEFVADVERLLETQGITQRMRSDKKDPNVLAVVDRLIQNMKLRLAESLAANPGEWADRVDDVVRQYNATPHGTLYNEPPDEVRTNKTVQFMLDQDNAEKLAHNENLLKKRKAGLEDAGAFRRPIGSLSKFKRGFRASYGDKEDLQNVTGSMVQPVGSGDPIDIKRVMPVDAGTGEVHEGFALGEARREAKRQTVQPLALEMFDFIGDREVSVQSVAAHLRRQFPFGEYETYLQSVGAGRHLSNIIELFSDDLEATRGGYYVQRA